ncbi:hypothetical protein TNCV_4581711 [Trichonephila clavipes]|nr:hypothetical protein TNCV_4581711 [Trichonephila clavipes]
MADYEQILTESINLLSTSPKAGNSFLVRCHIGGYQSPQIQVRLKFFFNGRVALAGPWPPPEVLSRHHSSTHCRYIEKPAIHLSGVPEPMVLPYILRLPSAIFQQHNPRPHMTCNVQVLFLPIRLNCFLGQLVLPICHQSKICGLCLHND